MADKRRYIKLSAAVLFMLFSTYLVPEHYLKGLHPHEHPATCSHHCSADHNTIEAYHDDCDQEKDYFFSPLPDISEVRSSSFLIGVFILPAALGHQPLPELSLPPRSPPGGISLA